MEEEIIISKNTSRPASQDYELLRQEGLKHIEDLAHDLWTDYNTHDPGITILEALCYAITELGYRCGFDMKDLLCPETTGLPYNLQAIYTAKEILTNNPLTSNDYRKLLIDIDGIHNAWMIADDTQTNAAGNLLPVNEVPVYADFINDKLTYTTTDTPLFISGLYKVLLDLEQDDNYGDLNTGDIMLPNPAINNYEAGAFMLTAELPSWFDADLAFAEKAADKITDHISSAAITETGGQWKCELILDDNSATDFIITVAKKPAGKTLTTADINLIISSAGFLHDVFSSYIAKITKTINIIHTAAKRLHETRNLCEDYISIDTVASEEVSFCFDVDVKPGIDIEKVQAEIFFLIEQYLNPSVDFYSLKELLDKKIAVDSIFNGPVLQHGFIDTVQLEQTQLRSVIHTSDIVNLLMDIEGVLAIRNFVMTKYNANGKAIPAETGLTWCMHVAPLHKPVLAKEKSKILLFKNQFPFLARYDEVRDTVLLLHAQHAKNKLNGLQQDIPVPQGNKRDTLSYWPAQYDFPQTYGISEAGLPSTATEERKAAQKQLKAYLMFYEQLLADFFAQLTNAPYLFSLNDITHTYYAQFLADIKDIDPVYVKSGSTIQLKDAIDNADSTIAIKNKWQDLYEHKLLFQDRRGRFLDHLLARFSESFNEYALMMYRINYENLSEEKISFQELSQAKARLLKNYPEISSQRGKAFNYFPLKDDDTFTIDTTALWNTHNISGLEKKICAIAGISDETRRFLYCIKNIEIICEEVSVTENGEDKLKCFHVFKITNPEGISMYNSNPYDTKAKATEAVLLVVEAGKEKDNYRYDGAAKKISLLNGNEALMETKENTIEANRSDDIINSFVAAFTAPCNDPAGLHLIEHILLRPRDNLFALLQVCLHKGECICEIDPYSFSASVVLPYWPEHFDNMTFREYFENKIQEEAPAHTMLKVCWLNNDLMREFEIRYKKWIETLADYTKDRNTVNIFRTANDAMVEILSRLHSEYPVATLHDCDESKEGSNTVVLGKTVLGTFKNQ
ncbi:MAG: hypothetical protein QM768_02150 [Agriterribacter sp.]